MTAIGYSEQHVRDLVALIERVGHRRPFTGFAVSLPPPPSANRLWRIFGNRLHKAKDYALWLEHCDFLCRHQSRNYRRFTTPVRVVVQIEGGKGFMESRDLDNCAKPVLDLLRQAEVLEDDDVRRVGAIVMDYLPAGKGRKRGDAVCRVIVEELS